MHKGVADPTTATVCLGICKTQKFFGGGVGMFSTTCKMHLSDADCVFIWLRGFYPQTPTGALPRNPAGGLSYPQALPSNPGYAPLYITC